MSDDNISVGPNAEIVLFGRRVAESPWLVGRRVWACVHVENNTVFELDTMIPFFEKDDSVLGRVKYELSCLARLAEFPVDEPLVVLEVRVESDCFDDFLVESTLIEREVVVACYSDLDRGIE